MNHYRRTNAPTAHISPLSLHDALPIFIGRSLARLREKFRGENRIELFGVLERFLGEATVTEEAARTLGSSIGALRTAVSRSEEHTSELQSRRDLVCRLLLEKKKMNLAR